MKDKLRKPAMEPSFSIYAPARSGRTTVWYHAQKIGANPGARFICVYEYTICRSYLCPFLGSIQWIVILFSIYAPARSGRTTVWYHAQKIGVNPGARFICVYEYTICRSYLCPFLGSIQWIVILFSIYARDPLGGATGWYHARAIGVNPGARFIYVYEYTMYISSLCPYLGSIQWILILFLICVRGSLCGATGWYHA